MGKKNKNKYRLDSWSEYTQKADLETWQRFMGIVGEDDTLPSKARCKKAMNRVFINIRDLIDAHRQGTAVPRFPSRRALIQYTIENRRFVSINEIETGSPMASLLATMF